jgi:hypothetical protein
MAGVDLDILDVEDILASPFFQKIDLKDPFVGEPSIEQSN